MLVSVRGVEGVEGTSLACSAPLLETFHTFFCQEGMWRWRGSGDNREQSLHSEHLFSLFLLQFKEFQPILLSSCDWPDLAIIGRNFWLELSWELVAC